MLRLMLFTAAVSLFWSPQLLARNFNMISVDSSGWPEVDVVAALPDGNVNAANYLLRLASGGPPMRAAYISGPLPSDPLNMLVALDTCRTMHPGLLDAAKEALAEYADYIDANERLSLMSFNENVQVEEDFTGGRRAFQLALREVYSTENETRLYLNLLYGIDMLKGMPGRRHLLLVADGLDQDGEAALEQAIQKAREHNVKVFTVGVDTMSEEKFPESLEGLHRLALETGGFHYKAGSAQKLQKRVYGLLDQQRSLARSERRHLYKLRFNLDGEAPQGVVSADLIRADGRDIRLLNFYLPQPERTAGGAVWEEPARISMVDRAYLAVSAAPPAGGGEEARLWHKPVFWLVLVCVSLAGLWFWRRYG